MESIRLRGPADVLTCLPYQLGYQPQDSVVVVALEDRRVGLISRLDLPAPEDVAEAAHTLVDALRRHGVGAALLVGYEEVRHAARPLLDEVAVRMGREGIGVLDRLAVHADRWYDLDCLESCCPVEGSPLPEPADVPAVAEFVALGAAPLPARDAVATLVEADPVQCGRVGAALDRVPRQPARRGPAGWSTVDRREEALRVWRRALDLAEDGEPVEALTPTDVACLVGSLTDVPLRDGLIAWLCPGTLPVDDVEPAVVDALHAALPTPVWGGEAAGSASLVAGRRLLARLQWLVRAVPDERATPVLTLLANVAWWFGDGALARVALDRALAQEPGYTLARLVAQLVDLGIRPGGPWSGRRRREDPRLV